MGGGGASPLLSLRSLSALLLRAAVGFSALPRLSARHLRQLRVAAGVVYAATGSATAEMVTLLRAAASRCCYSALLCSALRFSVACCCRERSAARQRAAVLHSSAVAGKGEGDAPHPGGFGERVRIASASRCTSLGKRPSVLTCTNAFPTRACTWDDLRISRSVTIGEAHFLGETLGEPSAMSDLSGSLVFDKGSLWKTSAPTSAEVLRNGPRPPLRRVTPTR